MSDASNEKLMGFIPKARYVYFTYMFLLVSAAFNALYSLIAIVGITLTSAVPAVIALGFLSLILCVLGLTTYKKEFSELDHAHFKYIGFLFIAFLIINIVFGGIYAISYFLGYLVTAMIGALQAALVWTGFNSWQGGRVITKDNIKAEVQTAIKNR